MTDWISDLQLEEWATSVPPLAHLATSNRLAVTDKGEQLPVFSHYVAVLRYRCTCTAIFCNLSHTFWRMHCIVTIPIMRIKNIFFPWQNWMRQWYLVCASARSNARRRVIHQSKALLLLFLVKWLSRLRDVCPVSKTNSSALYCEKYGENQLEIKFSRKYRGPRWQSAW